MQLQDLLDELRASVLRDASALKSGPSDRFWSDDALVRYLNDAHSRFARGALCIRDDTNIEVTQVPLQTGVDTYPLHKSIIKVMSARHELADKDLVRVTHERALSTYNPNTEVVDFGITSVTGRPTAFATDEGIQIDQGHAVRMRLYGVPTDSAQETQAGRIVYLRVIRKPLCKFALDAMEVEPEIPEDYHLDMIEWAAYRALRNLDVDGEDRAKANAHKARFEEAVGECMREVEQKMWQPFTWGFGRGGFGGYCR
jgi:hypothetical protein